MWYDMSIKLILKNASIVLVLGLLYTKLSYASSSDSSLNTLCDGTTNNPCIVQDTFADPSIPIAKHFRDAKMLANKYPDNTKGLKELWISASGVPSEANFHSIKKYILQVTGGKVRKIIDLDLQQESHGFLNGNSINLTSQYNWINLGKTQKEVSKAEKIWLQTLADQSSIKNILTSSQFKSGNFSQGVDVPVKSIQSEETLASNAGFTYQRLTITDHRAPDDEDVDRFLSLLDHLPPNTWIHLHCRGGKGRSTTFFAMADMLHNANQVSFDDILKRQAADDPYYNLAVTSHRYPTLTPYYQARYDFLKKFYQFARDRLNGYKGNWTEWNKIIHDNVK